MQSSFITIDRYGEILKQSNLVTEFLSINLFIEWVGRPKYFVDMEQ